MTSAKKKKQAPKPWELTTQSVVAGLADVSVNTVARARLAKTPPIGTLPWRQVGQSWKVSAGAVYTALDLDHDNPWRPGSKEVNEEIKRLRNELEKLTGAPAKPEPLKPGRSLAALLGLKSAPAPTRKKGGKMPIKAIQSILDQLRALGAPARLSINGKLMTFANMGDFLARAQPEDEWLFISPLEGRPMDLETALYLGCWEGRLELLSLDEYLSRLDQARDHEGALKVAKALDEKTPVPPPDRINKGRKRTTKPDK